MSASSKKKLRKEEVSAKLTEKQQAERKEAKKLQLYTSAFCIVMAAVLVAAIWIGATRFIANSGTKEKNTVALTVGSHNLSNAELNYFYVDGINNFYSSYGSYISLYGIEAGKPLNEQVIDEETGETWADNFLASAKNSAQSVYALVDAANAEGFALPEDQAARAQDTLNTMQTYAAMYGYSNVNGYLKAMYGNGASKDSFLSYLKNNLLANAYYENHHDTMDITEEAIRAKDAEDPNVYSSFSYNQYYLPVSSFQNGGTTAEDGTVTYTDEEKAAAVAAAEEAAKAVTSADIKSLDEFNAAIAALDINAGSTVSSTDYSNTRYGSVNSNVRDWIADSSRKAGDMTCAPVSNGDEVSGYYAVYYIGSTSNETEMVNVRHILTQFATSGTDDSGNAVTTDADKADAMAASEKILSDWKAGEATEDAFAALATELSADPGSAEKGGLYENVYQGQMVPAFNDWCFDASRQPGDTGIVETNYGTHVLYFVGVAALNYRDYLIREDLVDAAIDEWYNALLEAQTMTDGDASYIRMDLALNAG